MNDQTFSEELISVLSETEGLAGVHLVPELTSETATIPKIVFAVQVTPFGRGFRMGKLTLTLTSHYGDEETAASLHQGRFTALWSVLLGEPAEDTGEALSNESAAKEAIRSAVNAREKIDMMDYGIAPEGVEASVDGDHFVTTLTLNIAFRHLTSGS